MYPPTDSLICSCKDSLPGTKAPLGLWFHGFLQQFTMIGSTWFLHRQSPGFYRDQNGTLNGYTMTIITSGIFGCLRVTPILSLHQGYDLVLICHLGWQKFRETIPATSTWSSLFLLISQNRKPFAFCSNNHQVCVSHYTVRRRANNQHRSNTLITTWHPYTIPLTGSYDDTSSLEVSMLTKFCGQESLKYLSYLASQYTSTQLYSHRSSEEYLRQ